MMDDADDDDGAEAIVKRYKRKYIRQTISKRKIVHSELTLLRFPLSPNTRFIACQRNTCQKLFGHLQTTK